MIFYIGITFYTTLILTFNLMMVYAIPVPAGIPESQMQKMKKASKSMDSSALKSNLYEKAARAASAVGMKGQAKKWTGKAAEHINAWDQHLENLSIAVNTPDFMHEHRGAKSHQELYMATNKAMRKLGHAVMILKKLTLYLTLLLYSGIGCSTVNSLPATGTQTESQFQKIKKASRGMEANEAKANLCMVGSSLASCVGLQSISRKLVDKSVHHLSRWGRHKANLREAVEAVDTTHEFGGAKSQKALQDAIEKGKKRLE
ncbi:uncharacterized protein FA14DRAFT_186177 [Meira miltonrushii]|uniref:Uncharacterized protein n=1 Tax=Meira miltonrushii TaxID=1280837 RepID=A0A316V1Z0_9BASI|nr:uncharacterized protein FA14DRAFT_186177 [Meira miltonrushii]PWN31567.1 hypothetical protein FA14DRAFT_186177 [Meira miltonrushii]